MVECDLDDAKTAFFGDSNADTLQETKEFFDNLIVRRTFRVYGKDNSITGGRHRIKESFGKTITYNFDADRIITIYRADKTGTNDYVDIEIGRATAEECEDEIRGQITDGIFECQNYGDIFEIIDGKEAEVILWQ